MMTIKSQWDTRRDDFSPEEVRELISYELTQLGLY
jgi:hypothetical protein